MTRHVHILGICGYASSGAAMLALERGDRVTGSDDGAYPPVSTAITAAGIAWENHSDPANLDRWGTPDIVVVGNQTRAENPEYLAARERGCHILSEIEFFTSLAANRMRLTVCGTHGKTTTAALLAHMLERAGLDPGLRLGSTSLDLGSTARLGSGPFVFEGDEYTTAPWDPRPKFLHTHPHGAAVTRLELDHPDVYPTLEMYRAPFRELAAEMPESGLLALCADDAECGSLREHASCAVVTYGTTPESDWRILDTHSAGQQQRFMLRRDGAADIEVSLSFPGLHNAQNACAAMILAEFAGAPLHDAVAACGDFKGAARRFEVLCDSGDATVIDDYAHHPTEIAASIAAVRQRYGNRRLIVVHTPHTYSRTLALLEDYRTCFRGADMVVLGPLEPAREGGAVATVSSRDVAARVESPQDVHLVSSSDDALEFVSGAFRPGDVVLVLSVSGFDKFAPRLRDALAGARVAG